MSDPGIVEAIGGTPLVELRRIVPSGHARVLVKLESHNPTGSLKDRMALSVVDRAVATGRLRPRGRLVEYSGGSTGTSLALSSHRTLRAARDVFALRLAESLGQGRTVVTILCDSGLKYLSTDLFAER